VPAIVVHSLAHAVAALEASAAAGRPVILLSAPEAGLYAGAGWFRALIETASATVPAAHFTAWLDCGDDAGAALAALRAGIEGVIFASPAETAGRLADIAGQCGAVLVPERPVPALDLGEDFFASAAALSRRCAEAIASDRRIC
jgi:hypothetical protein